MRPLARMALVLGAAALALAIWAFATPTSRQVTHDTFAQVGATYTYTAAIVPDALYPSGGTAPADSPVFPNITKELTVSMLPTLTATGPMKVSLHMDPVLRVIAQGLWQQDSPLGNPQSFSGNLSGMHLAPSDWSVDVAGISGDISSIEKAILAVPTTYLIVLDPRLSGVVTHGGEREALNWDPRLTFAVQSGTWLVRGPLAFSHRLHFQQVQSAPVAFQPLGIKMSPLVGRLVFGLLAVLLLALWALLWWPQRAQRPRETPWQRLDRKHRGRIVRTSVNVQSLHRELVYVESFDVLLRMVEEKELPILRSESPGTVEYVVVDGTLAYAVRYPRTTPDVIQATVAVPGHTQGM